MRWPYRSRVIWTLAWPSCSEMSFGCSPWAMRRLANGGGRQFRVLDVVIFDEEDESPLVGLLQVEAA
jgi:hypothetical protein